MQLPAFKIAVYCSLLLASPSLAAAPAWVGGDLVAAGGMLEISQPSPRDLVASGLSIGLTGGAAGDVALAGFDLDVQSPVGDDLYAAGGAIPSILYRIWFRGHGVAGLRRSILNFVGIRPVRENLFGLAMSSPNSRAGWLRRMRALGATGR